MMANPSFAYKSYDTFIVCTKNEIKRISNKARENVTISIVAINNFSSFCGCRLQ